MIEMIEKYCRTNKYEDFEKISKAFIFYVDWREADDAIVEACANRIQTGSLNAKLIDDILLINYEGKVFQERITNSRDTTVKFLNKVLLPKYEIRFCAITFPADTLGFIILLSENWKVLEEKLSKVELDKVFEPIKEISKIFDRDFNIEFDDGIKL